MIYHDAFARRPFNDLGKEQHEFEFEFDLDQNDT